MTTEEQASLRNPVFAWRALHAISFFVANKFKILESASVVK